MSAGSLLVLQNKAFHKRMCLDFPKDVVYVLYTRPDPPRRKWRKIRKQKAMSEL